jgi:hypothetical protein
MATHNMAEVANESVRHGVETAREGAEKSIDVAAACPQICANLLSPRALDRISRRLRDRLRSGPNDAPLLFIGPSAEREGVLTGGRFAANHLRTDGTPEWLSFCNSVGNPREVSRGFP